MIVPANQSPVSWALSVPGSGSASPDGVTVAARTPTGEEVQLPSVSVVIDDCEAAVRERWIS